MPRPPRRRARVLALAGAAALGALGCNGGAMPPVCSVDAPAATAPIGRPWEARTLRFVVLGDAGTGYPEQRQVGQAIRAHCEAVGDCALALVLGDNVYRSGLSHDEAERTAQIRALFLEPYANVDLPFYVVVGNHDHGFQGLSLGHFFRCSDAYDTALLEVGRGLPGADDPAACALGARGRAQPAWCMPALDYAIDTELAGFVALDTTPLLWDRSGDALAKKTVTARSYLHQLRAHPWRFVYSHHPLRTVGAHGDAGAYVWAESADHGERIRTLYERIGPEVDVLFHGHDHDLELRPRVAGCAEPAIVVSGAGGKTSPLGRDPSELERLGGMAEVRPGFFSVRLDGGQLEIELIALDEAGVSGARGTWCAEKDTPREPARWRRGACDASDALR